MSTNNSQPRPSLLRRAFTGFKKLFTGNKEKAINKPPAEKQTEQKAQAAAERGYRKTKPNQRLHATASGRLVWTNKINGMHVHRGGTYKGLCR